MAPPAFDSIAELYDLMTNWEKRLPREVGWLDACFAREGVRTVLDAACGTGVHLEALAARGYDVRGSDLSPEMVERAGRRVGEEKVRVAGFDRAAEGVEPRDAVIVVGNSLPNAGGEAETRRALEGIVPAVRAGGILVVHTLSFPPLVREGGGLRPLVRVVRDGREHLFLKLFEVHPEKVVLDVIALVRDDEGEGFRTRLLRSDLYPLALRWLEATLAGLGLEVVRATDGFSETPYDEAASGDLLVVARRRR